MLTPDLCSRTYTAEVLRTRGETQSVVDAITRLTAEHRRQEQIGGPDDAVTLADHCFVLSERPYHRSTRTLDLPEYGEVIVPRTKTVRGKPHYLYDVLLAQCGRDVIVAVPYHGLAARFFVQVDRALAGKRIVYEKLDITTLVIRLGQHGLTKVSSAGVSHKLEIGVTRCQLAYSDPQGRTRDLQQVMMSGAHIGTSDVYSYLTGPVLNPKAYPLTVTPVVLGFALLADGIKKTSATTDRHGNFKLWVGPSATRIERLFVLLSGIESIQGVVSTTSNLPILQSAAIRGTREG